MFRRGGAEYIQETPVVRSVRGLVQEGVSVRNGCRKPGIQGILGDGHYFTVDNERLLLWMKGLPGLEYNSELNGCPADYLVDLSLHSRKNHDIVNLTVAPQSNKWANLLNYCLRLGNGEAPVFNYQTEEEDMHGSVPGLKARGIADESHLRGVVRLLESVAVRKD
jgi:hypothetical protein